MLVATRELLCPMVDAQSDAQLERASLIVLDEVDSDIAVASIPADDRERCLGVGNDAM
jgi:hypothetical protein